MKPLHTIKVSRFKLQLRGRQEARRSRGGDVLIAMHGRSRMTIDPRKEPGGEGMTDSYQWREDGAWTRLRVKSRSTRGACNEQEEARTANELDRG